MKILLISYYYGKSASGNITLRVANELKRQGQEVFVITSDSPIDSESVYQCKNIIPDNSLIWRAIQKAYRILTKDELRNYFWVKRAYKKGLHIIKNEGIDCIYCRTSPLEACEVGYQLKKKTGIKTLLHFTDPEPSEFVIKNKLILKRSLRHYKEVINTVDIVSFGTEEMKHHQELLMDVSLGEKSFVSPDVSRDSEMKFLPKDTKSFTKNIVYLGSFGEYRNPIPLFNAIDSINEKGIEMKLLIYSNRPRSISYTSPNISFQGSVQDIDAPLKMSDVLVDIDAEIENNPYLSSKVKDYLPVNRPILEISKKGTPIYNLAYNNPSFCFVINDKESIESGLLDLINYGNEKEKYQDRLELVALFSPISVVKNIIAKIESVKNRE